MNEYIGTFWMLLGIILICLIELLDFVVDAIFTLVKWIFVICAAIVLTIFEIFN